MSPPPARAVATAPAPDTETALAPAVWAAGTKCRHIAAGIAKTRRSKATTSPTRARRIIQSAAPTPPNRAAISRAMTRPSSPPGRWPTGPERGAARAERAQSETSSMITPTVRTIGCSIFRAKSGWARARPARASRNHAPQPAKRSTAYAR